MVRRDANEIFLSLGQLGQLGKALIGNNIIVGPFGQIDLRLVFVVKPVGSDGYLVAN